MPARPRPVRYDVARACQELAAADARLGKLMERGGPFRLRLKPTHSVFEALLESITHQQLHGRAAQTIHNRVLELFPERIAVPERVPDLSNDLFRAAGLSGSKLAAIRDLSAKCLSGEVPPLATLHRLPDDEVCARLSSVRGIGVWTAQMLLIFRMGRPDVLPVADYGVRKGFALTIGRLRPGASLTAADLPSAAIMERRARRWRPWRSVASWYLWRACDLASEPAPSKEP